MPSVFTQIVNGDIPCHKILEDDRALEKLHLMQQFFLMDQIHQNGLDEMVT